MSNNATQTKVGISRESLLRLAETERKNLEALRAPAFANVDQNALADMAILRGKALHRYVLSEVVTAMSDLSFSDPAVSSLLNTANDYVRLGTHLKAGTKETKRHG